VTDKISRLYLRHIVLLPDILCGVKTIYFDSMRHIQHWICQCCVLLVYLCEIRRPVSC